MQELAGHAEGRVEELETAERDRAEAAAEIAKQFAEVGERERELKRERAAFEARQQEAEARLSSRESTVRERDGRSRQRERDARELEAERDPRARRRRTRGVADEAEERLAAQQQELAARTRRPSRSARERAAAIADGEASLQRGSSASRSRPSASPGRAHGARPASQDAFALHVGARDARERASQRREAELHEAQARLQAAAADDADAPAQRELDEREGALVAREAELNRRLAAAARDEQENDLVEQLRAELQPARGGDRSARAGFAERRERLESREAHLHASSRSLEQRATEPSSSRTSCGCASRAARPSSSSARTSWRARCAELEERESAARAARDGPRRLRRLGPAAVHRRLDFAPWLHCGRPRMWRNW